MSTDTNHPHYRPEIDGLRALAVVLVILFHLGLRCPGGYVGVDVFFVISGYLITGLIARQVDDGSFSLQNFWLRRVHRILPAQAAMVACVLVYGMSYFLPSDAVDLAEMTRAQQVLGANLHLTAQDHYFSPPFEQVLMHTWSLAVEEQFYLLFPILMIVLLRCGRWISVLAISLLAVSSLVSAVWALRGSPDTAYYQLQCRAWELLMGAGLALLPASVSMRHKWSQLVAAVGLGMILYSAWFYGNKTPFPGVAALVPCLGTALILWSNQQERNLVGKCLAWRPVVLLGLMSYSLYLWHWPVIACLRYFENTARLPQSLVLPAVGATFVLAAVSYRWIERPCRISPGTIPTWRAALPILATVPTLLLASSLVIWGKGFPTRFSPRTQRLAQSITNQPRDSENQTSRSDRLKSSNSPSEFGDPSGRFTCVVWGDSFAGMWHGAMESAAQKNNVRCFGFGRSATPPILDFAKYGRGLDSSFEESKNSYVEFMRREQPDLVILAGMWETSYRRPHFEQQLRFTLQTLHDAGLRVAVMLPPPLQDRPVARALALHSAYGHPSRPKGKSWAVYLERPAIRAVYRACEGLAEVIDPGPCFVNAQGIWTVENREGSMYSDHCHVSRVGALRATPLFDELFATLSKTSVGREHGTTSPEE